MNDWLVNAATMVISILGAAVVVGLTFGRLQEKVTGMAVRLDRIEKEHTEVFRQMSAIQATVNGISATVSRIDVQMDNAATKAEMLSMTNRIDALVIRAGVHNG